MNNRHNRRAAAKLAQKMDAKNALPSAVTGLLELPQAIAEVQQVCAGMQEDVRAAMEVTFEWERVAKALPRVLARLTGSETEAVQKIIQEELDRAD